MLNVILCSIKNTYMSKQQHIMADISGAMTFPKNPKLHNNFHLKMKTLYTGWQPFLHMKYN